MSIFKKKVEKPNVILNPSCVFSCLKEKCPKWVVMSQTFKVKDKEEVKMIGKCADAWIPELLTEVIQALRK